MMINSNSEMKHQYESLTNIKMYDKFLLKYLSYIRLLDDSYICCNNDPKYIVLTLHHIYHISVTKIESIFNWFLFLGAIGLYVGQEKVDHEDMVTVFSIAIV